MFNESHQIEGVALGHCKGLKKNLVKVTMDQFLFNIPLTLFWFEVSFNPWNLKIILLFLSLKKISLLTTYMCTNSIK